MNKHFSQSSFFSLFVVLLIGGFLAACAEEQTQQTETTTEADTTVQASEGDFLAAGRASYETYCMSCHGPEGKGNGELATDLEATPADLTQLSAHHNGSFPVDLIVQTVDGREQMAAGHGTREMPVWGNIWSEEDGTPVPEDVVERRINELVEYLRSIQQ